MSVHPTAHYKYGVTTGQHNPTQPGPDPTNPQTNPTDCGASIMEFKLSAQLSGHESDVSAYRASMLVSSLILLLILMLLLLLVVTGP